METEETTVKNIPPTPVTPSLSEANTTSMGEKVGASEISVGAVDEEIDIDLFAKIKLRTATIEAVESVPKSKKLYKIQLDVGELGKRQIVSGIAQHYTPEQLIGKQIVIIANLKPAKLMGVESQGMLLAASTDGDGLLALLTPDKPIASGARVR